MTTNNHDDVTILKVKGEGAFQDDASRKEYVKSLASAVMTVISKHGHAKLKTVGASSGNNAWKAIIIARGEAAKRERILWLSHHLIPHHSMVEIRPRLF